MSMSGGSKAGEQRIVTFLVGLAEKTNSDKELTSRILEIAERLRTPIKFRPPSGGLSFGYEATILADICDVVLAARRMAHAAYLAKKREIHPGCTI